MKHLKTVILSGTLSYMTALSWDPAKKEGKVGHWWHRCKYGQKETLSCWALSAEDMLLSYILLVLPENPKGLYIPAEDMVGGIYLQNVYQCRIRCILVYSRCRLDYRTFLYYLRTADLWYHNLCFEGIPTYPIREDSGRLLTSTVSTSSWQPLQRSVQLMAHGEDHVLSYSLDSIRIFRSVGEPINDEAWKWYHLHVGKGRCLDCGDNWWQTETGSHMISGIGSHFSWKPTYAGYPLPSTAGTAWSGRKRNYRTVILHTFMYESPHSAMPALHTDHELLPPLLYFLPTKVTISPEMVLKEIRTEMYRIIGRVDDVINVSGHRSGTAEIENRHNTSKLVVESAVVGYPSPLLKDSLFMLLLFCEQLMGRWAPCPGRNYWKAVAEIGKIAVPEKIWLCKRSS